MERHYFKNNNLKLSYLDSEQGERILIALHSHWMEAVTFAPMAAVLAPEWRVIALDQRGHGYSDHATSYTRDDYLSDLNAFFKHLNITTPVVMLGNSLGGVNTYQFSARYPELIRAMIIEDVGVEIDIGIRFSLPWAGVYKTREDLDNKIGPRLLPYLTDSFRETEEGWRLAFEPAELVHSAELVWGDHWQDWLATDCPTLLIRGDDSRVTTQDHFEAMAARRENTKLVLMEGGHVLHMDNFPGFMLVINDFLNRI